MEKDRSEHFAFALGYFHGRAYGNENNPYDEENQSSMRHFYRNGYEWGVSDYCHEAESEEVNT